MKKFKYHIEYLEDAAEQITTVFRRLEMLSEALEYYGKKCSEKACNADTTVIEAVGWTAREKMFENMREQIDAILKGEVPSLLYPADAGMTLLKKL